MNLPSSAKFLIIFAMCLCAVGCYEAFQKRQDMNDVRRQFHLPADAVFIFFDSNPKSIRPEGLQIVATVQFTAESFSNYLSGLDDTGHDDTAQWLPVRFTSYSPEIGEEYSQDALKWKELPIPASLENRLRSWRLTPPGIAHITKGKYFCSVIATQPDSPLPNSPAAIHWKNVGRACVELGESDWPTIGLMGILDYEKKTLHAVIKFSG